MDAAAFQKMVTHSSGLLGVSEDQLGYSRSARARSAGRQSGRGGVIVLLPNQEMDRRVSAAALGGVDTLVFAGGIGENAVAVRARVCEGPAISGHPFG